MHQDIKIVFAHPVWPRLGIFLLVAAVTGAAFAHALDLASRLVQTSDSVQSLVTGQAVLKGNVLLRGWRFPVDNYYFTETLFYTALQSIAGPTRFLVVTAPAIVYALLVLAASVAAVITAQPMPYRVLGIAAVAFLLVCPVWIGNWNPLLFSAFHVSSTLVAMIALSLCCVVAARANQPGMAPVTIAAGTILFVLVAASIASDPFTLVFAFGPAIAVLAVDACFGTGAKPLALVLLISAVAAGLLLPAVIACLGDGFVTENNIAVGFDFNRWHNVVAVLCGLLANFGANFFDPRAGAGLFLVIRLLAFLLAVMGIASAARHLFDRDQAPLFDRLLCAGILSLLAACAVSAKFGNEITSKSMWGGDAAIRYLVAVVFFAGTLAGRRIPPMISAIPGKAARTTAQAVLVLLAGLATVAGDWPSRAIESQPSWIHDNAALRSASWLAQHGLKQGVGEYWSANLLTALSGGIVQIRSVGPYHGRLSPYVFVSNQDTYRQFPQFAIWEEPNQSNIVLSDVRGSYAVCAVVRLGNYRVALLRAQSTACPGTKR